LVEVLNQTETEGRSGAGLEAESTFDEGHSFGGWGFLT
jgi:hypothetical protein